MKVTKTDVRKVYPKRDPWSHKGDFGKVLVIGGSKKYTGAPGLAALTALKAGADLVTVAAPQRAAGIIATFSPDLITYPLSGSYITKIHLKEILGLADDADSIVIGSGIGRNKQTLDLILQLLDDTDLPCVIDADALHAFTKNLELFKENYILTPHSREFQNLFGGKIDSVEERIKFVKYVANKYKPTIILKGHVDVISNGASTKINETGNPHMTVGGTGDVLAGICGALLSTGNDAFSAACAAAYISGAAGDKADKTFGISLTALDVINNIYKVIG